MKKHLIFAFAALAAGVSFTSCSNEDNNPEGKVVVTIGFEEQAVNEDNFWIGDTKKPLYSYESYGSTVTVYDNSYQNGYMKFPLNYSVAVSEWGSYDYWSGFAISARTENTFKDLTPDQYNSVTGGAHTGKNFCVVQLYGEKIEMSKPVVVKSLWFTNSAYAVNSILNGDYYSGDKFDASDWFKCTIIGEQEDGTTASVDIDLAKDGNYVKDWQLLDLSVLGKVKSLNFVFSGSRTGDYGLNTPAYLCIDDVTVELN